YRRREVTSTRQRACDTTGGSAEGDAHARLGAPGDLTMPARTVRHDELELVRHAERSRELQLATAFREVADRAFDLRRLVADDNPRRLEHAHPRRLAFLVHWRLRNLHLTIVGMLNCEKFNRISETRRDCAPKLGIC